jgi:L-ribulose-5-phosphate 3-epimerase
MKMINNTMNRRQALQAGVFTALATSPIYQLVRADERRLFKIGACDWSLGRRQQLSALEVAREIGLDGVQVSFGDATGEYDLRKPEVRQAYAELGAKLNVEIASLGMGILNSHPYASDPDAERWVAECIDVMRVMEQRVVLLAFFGAGDINGNAAAQQEVIRRLKQVAPRAEAAGVVLGIESRMNAEDHLRILDAVGSPAVQVYYDVANMEQQGYDIHGEIRQLGRDRICEIHAKENGALLGQGKVDFVRVKAVLDDIGWHGWLIIEGATVPAMSMADCYRINQQYLRSVFPT